jgi:hypothetical protein
VGSRAAEPDHLQHHASPRLRESRRRLRIPGHCDGFLTLFREFASDAPSPLPCLLTCGKARPGTSRAGTNCRQVQHWATNVNRRLAEHEAGHGARLLAVVRDAGNGWQLARMWPGSRTRERQIKRQGGHARHCPLCGVIPRCLPRNADGSLSRSRTTDAQKAAAGVMTAAQLAEHTALRCGAITGKLPRPLERGPLADDPWAARPAVPPPHLILGGIP